MQLRLMSSFKQRFLGLHACTKPVGQQGVWLVPCAAIHTFFLPYSIDVLFLDVKHRVVHCRPNMQPHRMAWHWGAASVIELESGYCRRYPDYAARAYAAVDALEKA